VLDVSLGSPQVPKVLDRIPHVGPKRAQLLIDRFGEGQELSDIDLNPQRCFAAVGLSLSQASVASSWWRDRR
jgi:excinuclease UvrABC nuclease subunit